MNFTKLTERFEISERFALNLKSSLKGCIIRLKYTFKTGADLGVGGGGQKVPKNGFLTCFFKNFQFPKQRLFTALGELRKSIWST